MKKFRDTESQNYQDDFVKWLRENPQGYVVNDRGRDGLMIHRATCFHFRPHDKWAKTNTLKACSLEKRELEDWARNERNEDLLACNDCM
jgi:hypothetical protein